LGTPGPVKLPIEDFVQVLPWIKIKPEPIIEVTNTYIPAVLDQGK